MLRGSYDKVQSKHQESFPNDIFNFLSFPRKIFSLWHFEFFTLQSLRCNIFNSLYFQRKFSCCYVLNSMYLEVIKFSLGYTMIRYEWLDFDFPSQLLLSSLLPSHMFLTYFEPLVSENWGPGFLKRPKIRKLPWECFRK